eukprot:CAMPEP_0115855452 /NCGR_PEP_ID=MMETSP0287-20121206/14548_1 /TAXON_ID=412157 /ORGANISM="Chrysochromulina rotalis, Strain UIO044" /LENGTH=59 /DNA_ID=CAMNT_0003309603 /DNA_START=512 /DNA_END=688 /DNA_ORIENTATION=+
MRATTQEWERPQAGRCPSAMQRTASIEDNARGGRKMRTCDARRQAQRRQQQRHRLLAAL